MRNTKKKFPDFLQVLARTGDGLNEWVKITKRKAVSPCGGGSTLLQNRNRRSTVMFQPSKRLSDEADQQLDQPADTSSGKESSEERSPRYVRATRR